jgi:hypothetical protein
MKQTFVKATKNLANSQNPQVKDARIPLSKAACGSISQPLFEAITAIGT